MRGNPFPEVGYVVKSPDLKFLRGLVSAFGYTIPLSVPSSYTPDWITANLQFLTLTNDTSIHAGVAPTGLEVILIVKQDAVGGRVITWDSGLFLNTPSIDRTPNSITVYRFINAWTHDNPVWQCLNADKGVRFSQKKAISGTYTFNKASTTTWYEVDNLNLRPFLAASVGDQVVVKVHGIWNSEPVFAVLDAASIVGGSPVNWWGTSGGSSDFGIPSLYSVQTPVIQVASSCAISKTLVAGDIDNGIVTLGLFVRVGTVSANKSLFAIPTVPLFFSIELKKGPVIIL